MRGVDCDLVVGGVAARQPQVEVFDVEIHVGQDKLALDVVPVTAADKHDTRRQRVLGFQTTWQEYLRAGYVCCLLESEWHLGVKPPTSTHSSGNMRFQFIPVRKSSRAMLRGMEEHNKFTRMSSPPTHNGVAWDMSSSTNFLCPASNEHSTLAGMDYNSRP